jgi:hypothetical protein
MVVKTKKEGIYCIDAWQTVSDGEQRMRQRDGGDKES